MNYVEVYPLEILQGFSEGESYILMLMEPRCGKSIPILIGDAEAQNIIVAQEEVKGQRPSTIELMMHVMEAYQLSLTEVSIDRFSEGVFYATLHVSDGFYEKKIDSRSSDAIALALRNHVRIMMSDAVLEEAGIEGNILSGSGGPQGQNPTQVSGEESREELERMLKECEENEEYELAAEIAKRLKKL